MAKTPIKSPDKVVPARPTGRPVGRPSKYTPEIAERIFMEMTDGKDMVEICQAEDMPDRATVYRWMARDAEFASLCARAREALADYEFYRAKKLADDCTEENVNSARVKLNHLQWRIMKVSPRTYGDKTQTELTGANGGPIKVETSVLDVSTLDVEELEALEKALTATIKK